jgi:putative ABC transport system permease protein
MRPQRWLYTIPLRLRSLFRASDADHDLDEELQYHLHQKTNEFISKGLSPKEARYAALREFRGLEQSKENCRDARKVNWLQDLAQDLRFGIRMLRKSPGFTAVAILTLALGIGANAAIFSLIDAVMLKLLPIRNPSELVVIEMRAANQENDFSVSNRVWEEIRDRQQVFSGVAAYSGIGSLDLSQGGESHFVNSAFVSGEFFDTLGVQPAAGRLLVPSDDVRGCPGVAVASYTFARDRYGSADAAVGQSLRLSNHIFPIVGVTQPRFFGIEVGRHFDVMVPLCAEAATPLPGEPDGQAFLDRPSARWLSVLGRPKPGKSPAQVNAQLLAISPAVTASVVSPQWNDDDQKHFLATTFFAAPAAPELSDLGDYEQPLRFLMLLVGFVLLIACANISGLLIARGAARKKEIAVRLAMGASRWRLIRQLLTESMLLSFIAAASGVLLAHWGSQLLARFISTARNPITLELNVDGRVLAFTAGIAVFTAFLFGLLPAFSATRVSLTSAMKDGRMDEGGGKSRFRAGRWIVASQVGLSLAVIVLAGLFMRTFRNLETLDLGFQKDDTLLIQTNFQNAKVSAEQRAVMCREIVRRLKLLPGVLSASESFVTPVSGYMWGFDFDLVKGGGPTGDARDTYMNFVTPEYFATLRTPLIAGRVFDDRDVAGAPLVTVIDETMARQYFPNSSPIGQYLVTDDFVGRVKGKRTPPIQIVGVVKNTKYLRLRETTKQVLYLPIAQFATLDDPPNFELHTTVAPASLMRLAESAIATVNPNISLVFETLETQVGDNISSERLLATLSAFFGALALLLAAIGLYGVLAFMVARRRKEIGIRIALGAQRTTIFAFVQRDVVVVLALGIAAGLGLSYWVSKLTGSLLFGLDAHDPKTIVIAIGVLVAVGLAAGYFPARRATLVDPMQALREE